MLEIVILRIDCQNEFILIISSTKNYYWYYKNIYHKNFKKNNCGKLGEKHITHDFTRLYYTT